MTHLYGVTAFLMLVCAGAGWYFIGWQGAFVGAFVGFCLFATLVLLAGVPPRKD